jgi:3-oxoacyl-ACP reductase-like protein
MSRNVEPDSMFTAAAKKRGLFIPFAAITVAGSLFGLGSQVFSWYEARKRAAIEQVLAERAMESRIKKLERWHCAMGGRPPDTIDWQRKCDND